MAAVAATQAVGVTDGSATTALPATPPTTTTTTTGPDEEDVDYYGPKRGGWFVVLVILLLVALGGLVWLLCRTVFADDDEPPPPALVEVPSVVELPVDEATDTLREAGFEVTPRTEENEQVDAGIVFAQDPAAGTRLEEGETVTITVSAGAASNAIPEVRGSTEATPPARCWARRASPTSPAPSNPTTTPRPARSSTSHRRSAPMSPVRPRSTSSSPRASARSPT